MANSSTRRCLVRSICSFAISLAVREKPVTHANIKVALPGLLQVPFRFEGMGSQIVFYQQEMPIAREMSWSDDKAAGAVRGEPAHAWKVARS